MAKRSAKKASGLPAQPRPRAAPPPVRSKGAGGSADRKAWYIGGAAVAVLAVIGIVLGVVLSGGSSSATTSSKTIAWDKLGVLQSGAPPWNNGSGQLRDRLDALGLSALGSEGTVLHIHQHLDVYVNGKKVTVPALIGIDEADGFLTELHTHDNSGILHVESPTQRSFELGQVFGEWGVKLTPTCISTLCGKLSWWVNGKKMTGNPAQLVLKPHQEIVIVSGTKPAHLPTSYKFPAGL
jgi:hypothetical protein